MEGVRRRSFTPEPYAAFADRDMALPIGCGQTMPDPFHVARVLEALEVLPASRVLEVGAGSGYMTALLGRLSREVVSVERFRSLAFDAKARLAALGVGNASVEWADGLAFNVELGLFDRILVDAGVIGEPANLLACLSDGGIMLYPERATPPGPAPHAHMRRLHKGLDGLERTPLWSCRAQLACQGRSQAL